MILLSSSSEFLAESHLGCVMSPIKGVENVKTTIGNF